MRKSNGDGERRPQQRTHYDACIGGVGVAARIRGQTQESLRRRMLELEVVPERSIGCDQWEFILGMHFSQSVSIIQSQVGIIRGVQVLYSDTNPLEVDLVINLPHDGVRLIFDPIVQRLKIIEIYNMKLVKLKYCGLHFNSPEVLPSVQQIEHSFGATHPGVYDKDKQVYVLNFRGLSFYFPIDSKFEPGYAHGLGSLQFPNGSSPLVAKTAIYNGNMASGGMENEEHCMKAPPPPLPMSCYHNNLYLEKAEVIRDKGQTKGLKMHLFTEGSSSSRLLLEPRRHDLTREVWFGDSCEDVLSALGAPSRVFFKAEDKMRIHSPHAHKRDKTRRSDYFFNYFTLGLDILFDAKTQFVKKFILHTNYPGHYNFNMYHRCEFTLTLPSETNTDSGNLIDVAPAPVIITAYTKWDKVSVQLKASTRPVVLNRASSTNTINPFGCTFCYGIRDAIVEVMTNQHIASVTLYTTAA